MNKGLPQTTTTKNNLPTNKQRKPVRLKVFGCEKSVWSLNRCERSRASNIRQVSTSVSFSVSFGRFQFRSLFRSLTNSLPFSVGFNTVDVSHGTKRRNDSRRRNVNSDPYPFDSRTEVGGEGDASSSSALGMTFTTDLPHSSCY